MPKKPRVGAYVLETLTTGMYREPFDSIREYVQNSSDSIREAEAQGKLKSREGRIAIEISDRDRLLSITDNGVGVPADLIERRLLDIGMSVKLIEDNAGFRGIGRLAGIAYCDRLSFITTATGEDTESTLTINCVALKAAITPANRTEKELGDILQDCTSFSASKAKRNEHRFIVRMDGVSDERTGDIMDWQKLDGYLGQVAPVEFDAQRFVFASKIKQFIQENSLQVPAVTLTIKNETLEHQVFKPYKTTYVSSAKGGGSALRFDIKDVAFFRDSNKQPLFWLWYGISELLGSIEDEKVAGIRIRMHNIAIDGADRIAEMFEAVARSNRRFNGYFIGELHIISSGAVPNARRDGFEETKEWKKIRELLRPYIEERCTEVRSASGKRNLPIPKVFNIAEKLIDQVNDRLAHGLSSKAEKDELTAKLAEASEKLEEVRRRPDAANSQVKLINLSSRIDQIKNELSNGNNFVSSKVPSSLSRKERAILELVIETIHTTLRERGCSESEECFKALRDSIVASLSLRSAESKNGQHTAS